MPPRQRTDLPQGITLLGGPQTGKTTFLAALQIALLRREPPNWSLHGENPGSTRAMVKFMDDMTRRHAFPAATVAQMESYKWSLTGNERRTWHLGRRGVQRGNRTTKIGLNLVDGPGAAADGTRIYEQSVAQQLIASMNESMGIMVFFDPLTEVERGQSFQHLYGALKVLQAQVGSEGKPLYPDGKLPHYVAVCITKFDSIPVYRSAQTLKLIRQDPDGQQFPHVPEMYAEEFLKNLIKMSRSDDSSLIVPVLKQTFYSDRIKFFVTSSIGFYVDRPAGRFDPEDYQNHVPGKPDRIRGGIYPINVVEPVLWLGQKALKAAR
jgi:hypothetical protein